MGDSIPKRIPVIIDTDPGVDDALALKIAFGSKRLDIRLVCSVAGNVSSDFTTANALYLTKKYGGNIPVVKGSAAPLSRAAVNAAGVHGAGGIGDYTLPPHPYTIDSEDGVAAMAHTLAVSEEKVTLITLGPLTNIAGMLSRFPESAVKIEAVYAMIGAVDGTGNITDYAEFNAYCDPEALDITVKSGLPIIFAPMHLGRDTKLAEKDILDRGAGTPFGDMLAKIFRGYCDSAAGKGFVAMYDANAVEALIRPELYRFIRCTPQVNTTDYPGRTFLTPDENGTCFSLDVKEASAAEAAMLRDLFPER